MRLVRLETNLLERSANLFLVLFVFSRVFTGKAKIANLGEEINIRSIYAVSESRGTRCYYYLAV